MKKRVLVIRPRCGLTNQLSCIAKGIIWAHMSNRDLYIDSFQLDYRDYDNFMNIKQIINIQHLQNFLYSNGIFVSIENNIFKSDIKKIETFTTEDIYFIKDIISLIFHKDNISIIALDIDNPISSEIPPEYEKTLYDIIQNIEFTEGLKNIAINIIQSLNLNNYTCIHLRIENDALDYMKQFSTMDYLDINKIYVSKYIEETDFFELNRNNIYICTSLSEKDINYPYYLEIKEKYGLKDKNDIEYFKDSTENYRELLAIIDYMIAKKSHYFLGCDWSGFSLYIKHNHMLENKYVKIINIFESIKNL
jgi:hypothetical protein